MNQVVAFVATITWAYFSPTVWALAGGRLIAEFTRMLHSYWQMPEVRPRFVLDRSVMKEIVHFGKWILLGTILNYFALQSDRLILGQAGRTEGARAVRDCVQHFRPAAAGDPAVHLQGGLSVHREVYAEEPGRI